MNKLEELDNEIEKISNVIEHKKNKYFDQFKNDIEGLYKAFDEFYEQDEIKELYKQLNQLVFEAKKKTEVEWEDIPDYGDHMTLTEWKSCVKSGGFIDYDGFGNYASNNQMSNITLSPSDYHNKRMVRNSNFTHIVWFNK